MTGHESALGTLWLVSTPIGNLGDLTPRAIDVLSKVDLICCEDTRRTGKLLHHAGLANRRMAVSNDHTEMHLVDQVLATLGDGHDVAVVTDAGTPGISDPGERLVRAAVEAGYRVSAVPGPSADVVALVLSGLSTARYVFEGFLPRRGHERAERLAEIAAERRTIVLYEAPHRVAGTIADLSAACGPDRLAAVARELTKVFEEVIRGPLGEIDVGEPRGEYVVVIEGRPTPDSRPSDDDVRSALADEFASGASTRDGVAAVTRQLGVAKRTVYALALALQHEADRRETT